MMDKETKQNLIKILKEGSQRQFRKIKKEELIELIEEIWKEETEIKSKLLSEINELKIEIDNKSSLIESYKNTDNILGEYQDLIKETREKYEKEIDNSRAYKLSTERLYRSYKTMRVSFIVMIFITILTIIFAIIK